MAIELPVLGGNYILAEVRKCKDKNSSRLPGIAGASDVPEDAPPILSMSLEEQERNMLNGRLIDPSTARNDSIHRISGRTAVRPY